MKKKIFVSLLAAVFVGSCLFGELAMAAPNSSNKGTATKELKPVYSKGTKSDGAKRGSAAGGKPTNVKTAKSQSSNKSQSSSSSSNSSGPRTNTNRQGTIKYNNP